MTKGFDGRVVQDKAGVERLVAARLKASGLTPKDGVALGITPMIGAETATLSLWRNAAYPGMRFAYRDHTGADAGRYRVRCLADPLPELTPHPKTGKPRRFPKYVQPPDTPPWAYFPSLPSVDWTAVLADPKRDLVITEGELKAACATANGHPTVGLGGVWSFMSNDRGIGFLDELERIAWEGRRVYICYDRDVPANPKVDQALRALATRLDARGALPFKVSLPDLTGDKVGLDDFIVARGAKAFAAVLASAEEVRPWNRLYQLSSSGAPVANLDNALVALRGAPELQDAFAFDLMTGSVAVVAPLFEDDRNAAVSRPRTDHDDARVQRWLQREGWLTRIGTEPVRGAIELRARERAFHPIRDYLDSVKWDKTPRLDGWLCRYMGADDCEYARVVGPKFLISMVARVYEPGCKVDHMLIAQSAQGRKKSTVCEILAGAEWFSDGLPAIDHKNEKDLLGHLRGKWLIEIAELSSFRRGNIEAVKKFVTSKVDRYRAPYAHSEEAHPRQCVFMGTVNEDEYLSDTTGNRRFWPVSVGLLDVDALRADRDQLFAEARVRYKAGEVWYPTEEQEERLIRPQQGERFSGGEWDDRISEFLTAQVKVAAGSGQPYHTTTSYVAEAGLGFEIKQITSETCRRVAAAMKRLGWTRTKHSGLFRYAPPDGMAESFGGPSPKSKTRSKVVEWAEARKKKY